MASIYSLAVLRTVLVALGNRLSSEGSAPPSPLAASQRVVPRLDLRSISAHLVPGQVSASRHRGQVLHDVQRKSFTAHLT